MVIKKAEEKDCLEVVELIKLAIGDMAETYTGYSDPQSIHTALKSMYLEKGTRFSFQSVHVALLKKRIAGQITAYPARYLSELNLGFKPFYNPNAIDKDQKINSLLESKEVFDDEYYIDSLAVFESYRGLGIARNLIQEVALNAGSEGYNKLSLLVDINNEAAEKLYEKLEFKVDKHINILGHPYKHMIKFIF